jgi:hypothetical protein
LIASQLRSTSPRLGLDVAEDVRVAADQLLAAVLGDRGESPGAALLEQQREEVDLEEHVAELVEQLRVVARVARRRRARRPPRPCAGRSSARPARGPTGTRAQAAGQLVEASKTSQTAQMRPASGISSPRRPPGSRRRPSARGG